ncbi:DUF6127 family protein [Hyphomonas sp.]|jgi:hypothetical protein|uniref:DUF6127 family protein n=1 Tax=Hyphomonas sp. TaxID=87 RepID=UPI003456FA33
MTELELELLIVRAAAAGARKALADVGLHDEDAGKDVQELRGLLESWRDTKRTVTQTIARIITGAILFALAAGAWLHLANRNP